MLSRDEKAPYFCSDIFDYHANSDRELAMARHDQK